MLAIMLLQMAAQPVLAQSVSFEDVIGIRVRNMGVIRKGNEVTGYYLFYAVDKAEKGKVNYLLKILDNNLEQVASKSITDDKGVILRECAYNGSTIMLKFQQTNGKEKNFIFRQYDMTGERRSLKNMPVGELDYEIEVAAQLEEGALQPTLIAVPGKGFVNYTADTEKGKNSQAIYRVNFFPDDTQTAKEWKYASKENSEFYESAYFMTCNDKVLLSTIVKRKNRLSKDIEFFIHGIDLNTGRRLFETSVEDSKYAISIINGEINGDSIQLYGLYYDKDAKVSKDKSLGLCSITIDMKGKAGKRRYISWAKDVSKFLPANEKGKIEDIGYLFFHKFIRANDGTVFGIAESYRKAASGLGIAVTILGGEASVAKMVIEDFYLFQFTPDFKIKDVRIIEKNKSSIQLHSGMASLSQQILAVYLNYWGCFDYSFTQQNSDNSIFSVGYLDYEVRKDEKDGWIIGTLNYADNEWVNDKIRISSYATNFNIMPAKPGYVVVYEYFPKAKKFDFRLEKLNF